MRKSILLRYNSEQDTVELNQTKRTGYENQEKYLLPVLRNMYFKPSQI